MSRTYFAIESEPRSRLVSRFDPNCCSIFRIPLCSDGDAGGVARWTERAFVETDPDGHVAAGLQMDLPANGRMIVHGQRGSHKMAGHALLEWASDAANWRLTGARDTESTGPGVALEHVRRLARNWCCGARVAYASGPVDGASFNWAGLLRYAAVYRPPWSGVFLEGVNEGRRLWGGGA